MCAATLRSTPSLVRDCLKYCLKSDRRTRQQQLPRSAPRLHLSPSAGFRRRFASLARECPWQPPTPTWLFLATAHPSPDRKSRGASEHLPPSAAVWPPLAYVEALPPHPSSS